MSDEFIKFDEGKVTSAPEGMDPEVGLVPHTEEAPDPQPKRRRYKKEKVTPEGKLSERAKSALEAELEVGRRLVARAKNAGR